MNSTFFVRSKGAISGPFTAAQLQRLTRLHLIHANDELSTDRENWAYASQHPGLFAAGSMPVAQPEPITHPQHFPPVQPVAPVAAAVKSASPAAPPTPSPAPPPQRQTARAVAGFCIRTQGLGREVIDRSSGKPRMLIRDVGMVLKPGELIALVGASGAGKSTLFGALSGRVRGTHGQVFYDGQPLYDRFNELRAHIGYVPQRDVFHDALPVVEALRATSRLRLPRDTPEDEIDSNIDRVLKIVSLTERRRTTISNLSGGEQKRVAIALELLSKPRVLFLDEPTAPLDPRTTAQMMQLFRELAESGITVVIITHAASSLDGVDLVAYMHKGILTFQGPPERMKEFFDVSDLGQAYTAETQQTPEAWRDKFRAWPSGNEFAMSREREARRIESEARPPQNGEPARRRTGGLVAFFDQTRILTARYFRVLTVDKRNLLVLLILAPVVTAMLCLATSTIDTSDALNLKAQYSKQRMLCFGGTMICIFLALFGSVREIVKELPIYLHEHFMTVNVLPYLLSKIIVLLGVGAVQTAMVVAVINYYGDIDVGTPKFQYGVLFLCSAVGTMIGLMISALVAQSDHAVTGMIIIVIPEILFSGALIPIKGVSKFIAGPLITAYWGFSALMAKFKLDPALFGDSEFVKPLPACLTMIGQFAIIAALTYWLMVRKDGPGAAERIAEQMKASILRGKNVRAR